MSRPGLAADDLVVVDGLQRAVPGQTVEPATVNLTDCGPMIAKFFIERPVLANVLAILFVLIGGVSLFDAADRAASGRGAADGSGDHSLSRRQRHRRHEHCRLADRAAGERRPGHAVHAVHQRQRRQLYADGHLRDRHGPRTSPRYWCRTGSPVPWPRCRKRCRRRASSSSRDRPRSWASSLSPSPDGHYDSLYLSNYAAINLQQEMARLPGVGNVNVFGAGQYAMRIWLDPALMQARSLTVNDVTSALQQQSAEVTAGQIGAPPATGTGLPVHAEVAGRLTDAAQFEEVIVKTGADGGGDPHPRHRPRGAWRADLQPGLHL